MTASEPATVNISPPSTTDLGALGKSYLVLPPSYKMPKEMSSLLANWGVIKIDGSRIFDDLTKGQFEDTIIKAKRKEYNSKPAVQEKKKEYFGREDVKAKRREYAKRPEVVERKRQLNERKSAVIKKLREDHPTLYLSLANKSNE